MKKARTTRMLIGGLCLLIITSTASAEEDPVENTTTRFFSAKGDGEIGLVLRQVSPLFGGREYYISSSGRMTIVDIRRKADRSIYERRFELEDLKEQTDQLFDKLGRADVLSMQLEQQAKPGPTCTNPPLLIFTNATGQIESLPLITGAPTKAYDDVLLLIAAMMKHTREVEPTYVGNVDTGFVPNGFEWTDPILSSDKDVLWAPHASAADVAKAEKEYLKKVQIQLKLIEENRQKLGNVDKPRQSDSKNDKEEN